jgi:hypothetical protein
MTEPTPWAQSPESDKPTADAPTTTDWGIRKRLLFRFFSVYLLLYALPFPFRPFSTFLYSLVSLEDRTEGASDPSALMAAAQRVGKVFGEFMQWQHDVVAWVAQNILRMDYEVPARLFTGSGDRTFNYVYMVTLLMASAVVCVTWSLIDRRRKHYTSLSRFVTSFGRYYLGYFMLTYGGMKIIKLQFRDPSMMDMLKPFGDVTPMELVWKFMGHSDAYTSFSGIGEITAALLLFYRPTQTLGALVTIGVMANVTMMNYAYRVPVKLFSTHLLLLAFVFLWLDRRRFIAVFLKNRPVEAADHSAPLPGRLGKMACQLLALLFVPLMLWNQAWGTYNGYKRTYSEKSNPALYGLYDVQSYAKNGVEVPPLLTDAKRWQNLLVEYKDRVYVRGMNSRSYRTFNFIVDETNKTITMTKFVFQRPEARPAEPKTELPAAAPNFTYEVPAAGELILTGELDGEKLTIKLKARNLEEMNCNRKFRWILERPYAK